MDTQKQKKTKPIILILLVVFLGSCQVALWFLSFLMINVASERIRMESISMAPALYPGDYVLVNKLAYSSNNLPCRGDVIAFKYPPNPGAIPYVKRIIGLPGDQIRIDSGKLYINGESVIEPYIYVSTDRGGDWTVPAGQYFVLGDNRNNSSDSRSWGFVPYENIIGRLEFIYLPADHLGLLSQNITLATPEP